MRLKRELKAQRRLQAVYERYGYSREKSLELSRRAHERPSKAAGIPGGTNGKTVDAVRRPRPKSPFRKNPEFLDEEADDSGIPDSEQGGVQEYIPVPDMSKR